MILHIDIFIYMARALQQHLVNVKRKAEIIPNNELYNVHIYIYIHIYSNV